MCARFYAHNFNISLKEKNKNKNISCQRFLNEIFSLQCISHHMVSFSPQTKISHSFSSYFNIVHICNYFLVTSFHYKSLHSLVTPHFLPATKSFTLKLWELAHYSKRERERERVVVLCSRRRMEGKEEDVKLGANKFSERQPIGTSAQTDKDYKEPPPAPLFEPGELQSWSFWRAGIAEFIATFLFLYITVLTVMGVNRSPSKCASVGIQGIAWAFGGMIFALVYCTAGISGNTNTPSLSLALWACLLLFLFLWSQHVETCTEFNFLVVICLLKLFLGKWGRR